MEPFSGAHPRSVFEPRTFGLARKRLTYRPLRRQPTLSAPNCPNFDTSRAQWPRGQTFAYETEGPRFESCSCVFVFPLKKKMSAELLFYYLIIIDLNCCYSFFSTFIVYFHSSMIILTHIHQAVIFMFLLMQQKFGLKCVLLLFLYIQTMIIDNLCKMYDLSGFQILSK